MSEPHTKLVRHLEAFSFFRLDALETSVEFLHLPQLMATHSLEAVGEEIARKTFESQPSVVAVDSSRALHDFAPPDRLREIVYGLASRVAHTDAVLLFVGEYGTDDLLHAPEFAVADGIIQLGHEGVAVLDKRWLRVAKLRGAAPLSGRHAVRIGSDGLEVYPRLESVIPGRTRPSARRISIGVKGMDQMMDGGIPAGSATLVAGPAGAGKTVIALHFIAEGLANGERCLYVSFQESAQQLVAKAASFGWEFTGPVESGQLIVRDYSPVEMDIDVVGSEIRAAPGDGLGRIVVDSLAEMQHATPDVGRFSDFMWTLVETFRVSGASSILTSETPAFFGPTFELARGVSFVVDNVVLLRYAELESEIRRALGVVKMRDSDHVKSLVEFTIGPHGAEVKGTFAGLAGVLTGTPVRTEDKFREFFNR